MFYAMGHFSKFLPPESVKISLTKSSNLTGSEAIAFQRPDKGTVVIVLNKNNYSIPLLFDDNSFKLHKELPANSIQSYIW